VITVWILVSAFAIHQILSRYTGPSVTIEAPGGKTAVSTPTYDKFEVIMRYAKPGQFLFQAAGPSLFLPLQLRNPLYMDAVETNQHPA